MCARSYDAFLTKYQREPTDEELIDLTNLSQKQYNSTIINKSNYSSLDEPVSEDGKTTIQDILVYNQSSLNDVFTRDAINSALKILNSKEYKVITEFYGLNDIDKRPIKDIAKEMNLGDERVRQLRKGAIKKLLQKKGKTLKTLL